MCSLWGFLPETQNRCRRLPQDEAQKDPHHIEDKIIDIAAAKEGKKLNAFYRKNYHRGTKKHSPKASQLWPDPRQKNAQGSKQANIPCQVDHRLFPQSEIRRIAQNIGIPADGSKRNKIQILFHKRSVWAAAPIPYPLPEQKPQHPESVCQKQKPGYYRFSHRPTVLPAGTLHGMPCRCRLR